MKYKRRGLSLIEAVTSLALIGLFLGLILTPSSRTLKQRQFRLQMAKLTQTTLLARQLAFNYDTPVKLRFSMEPGGILALSLECDEALKRASPVIARQLRLEGVEAFTRGHEEIKDLTVSYIARSGSPTDNSIVSIRSKYHKEDIPLGLD